MIVARYAARRVPLAAGFVVTLAFNVIVGSALLGVELVRRGGIPPPSSAAVASFVGAGLLTTFLARWFFYACVARFGPARASLVHISSPLVTALLGFAFLGERLAPVVVAAMIVVTAGLAAVGVKPGDLAKPVAGGARITGFGLAAGASVGYAVGNLMRGHAIGLWDEAIAGTLLGAAAAFGLQLVVTAMSKDGFGPILRADRRGLALYAAMGATTIVAQAFTIAAMAHAPVSIVALITLSTPLVVFPFSLLVLRNEERIGGLTIAGALLALGGIAVIVLR